MPKSLYGNNYHDSHHDPQVLALKKTRVIKALYLTKGIESPACRLAGVSIVDHRRWLSEDPEYRRTVDFIMDGAIDFVESKLFERINGVLVTGESDNQEIDLEELDIPDDIDITTPEGEEWLKERAKKMGFTGTKIYRKPPSEALIAFYLRTKGRKRGYTERTEIATDRAGDLFSGKSDEELLQMIKSISEKIS